MLSSFLRMLSLQIFFFIYCVASCVSYIIIVIHNCYYMVTSRSYPDCFLSQWVDRCDPDTYICTYKYLHTAHIYVSSYIVEVIVFNTMHCQHLLKGTLWALLLAEKCYDNYRTVSCVFSSGHCLMVLFDTHQSLCLYWDIASPSRRKLHCTYAKVSSSELCHYLRSTCYCWSYIEFSGFHVAAL